MKIIALAILFVLLFRRIKSTPDVFKGIFDKNYWRSRAKEIVFNYKENLGWYGESSKAIISIVMCLIYLFLAVFYLLLGIKINTQIFTILSAVQIFLVLCNIYCNYHIVSVIFDEKFKDLKTGRFSSIINMIVDYVYYIMAIYLLIK